MKTMLNFTAAMLAGAVLTSAPVDAKAPSDTAAAKPVPVQTVIVKAGETVPMPSCAAGLDPAVVIEPLKETAKGAWSASNHGDGAWLILLDDRAVSSKVKVATYCAGPILPVKASQEQ